MNETIYTLGVWTANTAQEHQFIQSWSEFAAWTNAAIEGTGTAILLRDKDNPRRFVSFGPWRSEDDVAKWRASEGFQSRIKTMHSLIEQFEPGLFTVAAKID